MSRELLLKCFSRASSTAVHSVLAMVVAVLLAFSALSVPMVDASPEIITFSGSFNLDLQSKTFKAAGIDFQVGASGTLELQFQVDVAATMDSSKTSDTKPIQIAASGGSATLSLEISAFLSIAGQKIPIGDRVTTELGDPMSGGPISFPELASPAVDLLIGSVGIALVPELVLSESTLNGNLSASGPLNISASEIQLKGSGEKTINGTMRSQGEGQLMLNNPRIRMNAEALQLTVRLEVNSSLTGSKSYDVGALQLPFSNSLELSGTPGSAVIGKFKRSDNPTPPPTTPPPTTPPPTTPPPTTPPPTTPPPTTPPPTTPPPTTPLPTTPPPPGNGESGQTFLIVILSVLGVGLLTGLAFVLTRNQRSKGQGEQGERGEGQAKQIEATQKQSSTSSRRGLAWLLVVQGPEQGREFRLTRSEFIIGTLPDCDFRLSDTTVSRRHAKVKWEDGVFFIYDLGSTNHTFINQSRENRHLLFDGDLITLGKTVLRFDFPS